jgi:hypothetical protein
MCRLRLDGRPISSIDMASSSAAEAVPTMPSEASRHASSERVASSAARAEAPCVSCAAAFSMAEACSIEPDTSATALANCSIEPSSAPWRSVTARWLSTWSSPIAFSTSIMRKVVSLAHCSVMRGPTIG